MLTAYRTSCIKPLAIWTIPDNTAQSCLHDSGRQGRSDGGCISVYIPPKSVYLKFFYVVVLSPCND